MYEVDVDKLYSEESSLMEGFFHNWQLLYA